MVPNMEGSMAGKFELYKDAKGKFRFRHQAGTGEISRSARLARRRPTRREA